MLFETVKSSGLAHLSYVVGDGGVCVVIDPRRDIEKYLEIARLNQMEITHILETHIHADFVSGSRELAARTGAAIYGGAIKNMTQGGYGFEIETLKEGDEIEVGSLTFRVLHTPGHSSEHLSFVLSGGGQGAEEEWAVFTGDSLFAGEVGRPNLEPGADHEELAAMLFDSLDKLMELDDGVEVYPGHGEGSPCGSSIGARDRTTIGYEREYNERLQIDDEKEFVQALMRELEEAPAPRYYQRLKRVNREGPSLLGALDAVEAMTAEDLEEVMNEDDVTVLDTREFAAFAGAHIPGSLNIALRGSFPVWAGRMLDPQQELVVIVEGPQQLETVRTHLLRIGLDVDGYLAGGFPSWYEAGKEFDELGLMSVHELYEQVQNGGNLQVLDVREPGEWRQGHTHRGCSAHLRAGAWGEPGAARSGAAGGPLLRQRISGRHRGEHTGGARVLGGVQSAGEHHGVVGRRLSARRKGVIRRG